MTKASGNIIWSRFCQNALAIRALKTLIFFVCLAVFSGFIANDKPLAVKYQGGLYFPVFRQTLVDAGIATWPGNLQFADWTNLDYQWSIFPPVPYSPQKLDFENAPPVGPFDAQKVKGLRWRHWLGTDELGRDILAGLIHGFRISLGIGLGSMLIALVLGLITGLAAGYFGDNGIRLSRARLFLNLFFLPLGLFLAFVARYYELKDAFKGGLAILTGELAISIFIVFVFFLMANLLAPVLKKVLWLKKKTSLPIDLILQRLIEAKLSIPLLFLFIAVIAITGPSAKILVLLIGFTAWTGISRFLRAEILREKQLPYIETALALGYSNRRVIFKHLLPNVLSPVFVAFSFGVAGAILSESSLSFLGLGVAPDTITWGSIMATSKQYPTCWWLAVFPGILVFLTVYCFYLVGEGLSDAANPRVKVNRGLWN